MTINCRATDLHTPTADHLDRVEELSKHDAGRQPDEWIQRPLQRAVSFPESAPGLPDIGPRLPHGSAEKSWRVVAEMSLAESFTNHDAAAVAETKCYSSRGIRDRRDAPRLRRRRSLAGADPPPTKLIEVSL